MQMNNQNKILFYFLILLSIFILLTFTKGGYQSVLNNMDMVEAKNIEYVEKEKVLKEIEEVSKNASKDINLTRYIHEVKEDELIDYFYNYVATNKSWSWFIIIDSINFDKWSKNEYAFNEWRINLLLTVSDETEMFNMLEFINSETGTYKFFIDNFSFQNDSSRQWSFQVNIPIKMFYK